MTDETHARAGGLCSATQLATILSVTPKTILNWADAGDIPVAIRTARTVRFNADDVMQVLAEATGRAQMERYTRRGRTSQPDDSAGTAHGGAGLISNSYFSSHIHDN